MASQCMNQVAAACLFSGSGSGEAWSCELALQRNLYMRRVIVSARRDNRMYDARDFEVGQMSLDTLKG